MTAARKERGIGTSLMLRALRSRNYKLFVAGQGVSLIGTWIQQIALSWLVYTLTHSAVLLGVVGFSSQIGMFVLSPLGGVVADRLNRHRLLIATQALAMAQALAIGVLVLAHAVAVWQIVALSLFLGVVNAFDMPARQAFVVDMIEERDDLPNAIALNSSMVNGARLVGPAVAGLLIAAAGVGWCFLINAASYVAVIAALLAMRIAARQPHGRGRRMGHELREGFAYTFGFAPIREILLLIALASVAAMPYSTLMPIFAVQLLHGGASTLGFLSAAGGVGALAGAAILAARRTVRGLGRWIPVACAGFGAALIAFSFSRSLPLSLLLQAGVGLAMITHLAASNTILQTIAGDEWRGRVMSFYGMAFMGMMPFGSLLAGVVAHQIGAPRTVMLGGAICIAGAAAFAWRLPALRKLVRPIYRERGIIPEVATGLEAATEGSPQRL
jgi:MFS family permease